MKNTSMKRIRFLHIPKTAGSSFTQCLRRIYGRGEYFFGFTGNLEGDLNRYAGLDSKDQIKLIAGHSYRIVGIKEIDELPTITFLREPLSRVKSFCQHVWEGKSPHLVKDFPPGQFDLDDFLSSGNEELDNLQVRILTGYRGEIAKHNSRQLIDRAIHILENDIMCFGLTEQFDVSLMLFRQACYWPWPTYRTVNKKKESKRIDFKNGHMEKIRELNAADIKFYETASDFFREKISKNREEMLTWLAEFERHQKVFQMYSWIYGIAGGFHRRLVSPERCSAAFRSDG
jgi:hypothetical protein